VKKLMIMVVGLYVLLVVASLVYAQAGAAKLAAAHCSACHSTTRVCEKLGTRSPEVWKQTVQRMVANGATLGPDEVDVVAEFLATAKPGSKPLCQ